jgi:hypothetical protein
MIFASINRLTSSRPAISYIARLTATATFAYLLALVIPAGTDRPVLAPLTALLVLQASLFQTIRSGIRKVGSVTAGVLVAVGVAEFIGFSWWQLAFVIAAALTIGRVLRLGDDLLEVPISAMLIFASAGTHSAATGRVVDTLVGTAAGLAGGVVFGAPRVQPARAAVGSLAGRLADLLSRMASDLTAPGCGAAADAADPGNSADGAGNASPAAGPGPACVTEWLVQARALRDEIERVDDTLREASDSVRFNPRNRLGRGTLRPVPDDLLVTEVALRGGLETLEHATVTVRGLARAILDSAGIDSERSPVRDELTRARLADVLGNLAEAIRTYGRLVQLYPVESESLKSELAEQLAAAHREQDELAAELEPRVPAEGGSSEWPLRGEILTHVDRLRTGLRPEAVPRPEPRRPAARPTARYRRRSPGQRDTTRRDRAQRDRAQRDRAGRERGHWVRRPFQGRRAGRAGRTAGGRARASE